MAEPPTTFATCPPLVKETFDADGLKTLIGGPFDVVQAYRPRNLPRAGKHLYIYRDYRARQKEVVTELGEGREWQHRFVAHILWSFTEQNRKVEDMERALEAAIARVLIRIRGPFGDKTHDNATAGAIGFNDVGDTSDEPEVEYLDDPRLAILAKAQVEVLVAYGANDSFFD